LGDQFVVGDNTRLVGASISGRITLEGFGGDRIDGHMISILEWEGTQLGLETFEFAMVAGHNSCDFRCRIFINRNIDQDSGFQTGSCPGEPCGLLRVDTLSISQVPGPVVGSGLPTIILAFVAYAWRRRLSLGYKIASAA
jgi:hypothetical protein